MNFETANQILKDMAGGSAQRRGIDFSSKNDVEKDNLLLQLQERIASGNTNNLEELILSSAKIIKSKNQEIMMTQAAANEKDINTVVSDIVYGINYLIDKRSFDAITRTNDARNKARNFGRANLLDSIFMQYVRKARVLAEKQGVVDFANADHKVYSVVAEGVYKDLDDETIMAYIANKQELADLAVADIVRDKVFNVENYRTEYEHARAL